MSPPFAVVLGTGRMAGGFVAPLLADAGWRCLLVGRDNSVCASIAAAEGLWLRRGDAPVRWVGGVSATTWQDPALVAAVARADLVATAVGPSSLGEIGRRLGPLVRERFSVGGRPLNMIAFENHRRAPEIIAAGLLGAAPSLAPEIGSRLGIAGAAVWRAISRRTVTADGVRYDADAIDEAVVDRAALVGPASPTDGSLAGLAIVRSFDDRMVEKLWLFNAGHAAAAYLGWLAGCATVDVAMARPDIASVVAGVVDEARAGFEHRLASRPWSAPRPPRPRDWILDRYRDPTLSDPISRVAREPRRKLRPDDRLIGAATACVGAGRPAEALSTAIAAAMRYAQPDDLQAMDIQRELELVGAAEVLAAVSGLAPTDELSRSIVDRYRRAAGVAGVAGA